VCAAACWYELGQRRQANKKSKKRPVEEEEEGEEGCRTRWGAWRSWNREGRVAHTKVPQHTPFATRVHNDETANSCPRYGQIVTDSCRRYGQSKAAREDGETPASSAPAVANASVFGPCDHWIKPRALRPRLIASLPHELPTKLTSLQDRNRQHFTPLSLTSLPSCLSTSLPPCPSTSLHPYQHSSLPLFLLHVTGASHSTLSPVPFLPPFFPSFLPNLPALPTSYLTPLRPQREREREREKELY